MHFLHCGGWQAYKNGFTASKETINVHHLNDVKDDNKPSNLVYVSTTGSSVISVNQKLMLLKQHFMVKPI